MQEAATKRPSAMIVILDLNNVPLAEFVNPASPANVLMRLCMNIFQVPSPPDPPSCFLPVAWWTWDRSGTASSCTRAWS